VQVGTAFVGAGWLAAFGVAGVFVAPRLFSSSSSDSDSDTPVRSPVPNPNPTPTLALTLTLTPASPEDAMLRAAMTRVETRWPESSYFLLSREAQRASGVSL